MSVDKYYLGGDYDGACMELYKGLEDSLKEPWRSLEHNLWVAYEDYQKLEVEIEQLKVAQRALCETIGRFGK